MDNMDNQVQNRQPEKEKGWEKFVGLNLLNKLGISFIVVSIIVFAFTSYSFISPSVQSLFVLAAGVLITLLGVFLARKTMRMPDIFTKGILACGICVLYISAYSISLALAPAGVTDSFMNANHAVLFGITLLVSIAAIALSFFYEMPSFLIIAAVGAFVPSLALFHSYTFGCGGMLITAAVTLFVFIEGVRRDKLPVQLVSFSLNLLGGISVCITAFLYCFCNDGLVGFAPAPDSVMKIAIPLCSLLYIASSYGAFLFMTVRSMRANALTDLKNVLLLTFSTALNTLYLFLILGSMGTDYLRLPVAAALAAVFGVLAFLTSRDMPYSRLSTAFVVVAVSYLAVIIPIQFGIEWLGAALAVEALGLGAVGVFRLNGGLKYSSAVLIIVSAFCTISFAVFEDSFWLKFLIVLVSATVLTALLYVKKQEDALARLMRTCVTWAAFFELFSIACELGEYFNTFGINDFYYSLTVLAAGTIVLSLLIRYIKPITDGIQRINAVILSFIGLFMIFCINGIGTDYFSVRGSANLSQALIAIGLNALGILAVVELARYYMQVSKKHSNNIVAYLSAYIVVNTCAFFTAHFDRATAGWTSSLVFMALAVFWILYGFRLHRPSTRRVGLIVALIVSGKLFLFDLMYLGQLLNTVCLFLFGLSCVGISLIYRNMSVRETRAALSAEAGIDKRG